MQPSKRLEIFHDLPDLAQTFLCKGAILVGSAAHGKLTSDFDIIVPWDKWHALNDLIPRDAETNGFRGWTFFEDGDKFDVWPDSLDRYIRTARAEKYRVVVLTSDYAFEVDACNS